MISLLAYLLYVNSQISYDSVAIGITVNNDHSVSASYIIVDEKSISTHSEIMNLNNLIKDSLYIQSSYSRSLLSYSFYTIMASKDFKHYSIYNIYCRNILDGCISEVYIKDREQSFSHIHYHSKTNTLFLISISPETRNYAVYSFNINTKRFQFVYDIVAPRNKNILSSTLIQSENMLYIDFDNGKSTTLLGIDLSKRLVFTFFGPLINDQYYTVSLLNDDTKFIYAFIYNRDIGVIQLLSIDIDTEEVTLIVSYHDFYTHYSSTLVFDNTKIYSFMANSFSGRTYLILTDLKIRTYIVKSYEGNNPLLISFHK